MIAAMYLIPRSTVAAPLTRILYPADVLDLTNWKITLPVPSLKKTSSPLEIRQPALATYRMVPWFGLTPDKMGVVFRAPVSAVTTSGSKYPRSELREMTDDGQTHAAWSSTEGRHRMYIDEAITAVPTRKQHVVAGQIHDASRDIVVIRLELPRLSINVDGKNVYTLESDYQLGTRFTVELVVADGQTDIYYNGSPQPVHTLAQDYDKAYFKAGAYTQSNCTRETLPWLCHADNYGEVVIYELETEHR